MIAHQNDLALYRHLCRRAACSRDNAERAKATGRGKWAAALRCRSSVLTWEAAYFAAYCRWRATGEWVQPVREPADTNGDRQRRRAGVGA